MCIVEVCVSGMQADSNGLFGCQVGRFRPSLRFRPCSRGYCGDLLDSWLRLGVVSGSE